MITLPAILTVSAALFCLGLGIALVRRNAILIFIGIELMFGSAVLNFIAFWRFGPEPEALTGVLFAMFAIAVAAGEISVGLALVILVYRHHHTPDLDAAHQLRG